MSVLQAVFPTAGSEAADRAESAELNAETLAALVDAHSGTLYRVAYSVVRHAQDAEDVVQETYIRVLKHAGKFREVRDARVWLIRIAWNLALDRTRRRKPLALEDEGMSLLSQLPSSEMRADAALAASEGHARILRLIDTLPAKERQVLLLSALEELSTVQIAGVLKTTESTVRSRLFRARQRLRAKMDEAAR